MLLRRLTVLTLLLLAALPAAAQSIRVYVDGQEARFDQPPAMVGGRVMVPLRGIFEALGAEVKYSAATRTIEATRGETRVELTLDSTLASVNGAPVTLDVAAGTVNGRTMVPLRFVSEALGAEVKWNSAAREIRIATGGGGGETPTAERPTLGEVIVSPARTLRPGDRLTVIAMGTPGGRASFDVLGGVEGIEMPEVSSGRYQGELPVRAGMNWSDAVLTVRLVKNGQEILKAAGRTVSVEGGQAAPRVTVNPAAGTNVQNARPVVTARFSDRVQPGSMRLFVDGFDMTGQAQVTNNEIRWQPGGPLSEGAHQARAEATDAQGQPIRYEWAFGVNPAAASATLTPARGATVGPRPEVAAVFGRDVHSVRFVVDGLDLTPQARITAREVRWTPAYDLSAGQHTVVVNGADASGATFRETWSFQVSQTQGQAGLTLEVTSPAQGQGVPAAFGVSGRTLPGARITVFTITQERLLGGLVTQPVRRQVTTGTADGSGGFGLTVRVENVPAGTSFDLEVVATDNAGATRTVTRRLVRENSN